ncbi:hypothetical protein P691DRAFT_806201 [Macrolepiota fuliginosa MF-IS2]|uniref:BTB domain-containing protein n=1 Tax=Macrolepiota fuliginosa MF-IS2 TaxID=1400762 RepID=A0A9P5X5U9_9AGAR|nr:hypothetical protein P691DRAFT_806201 [Macrolepiota fuliginosa MF-IS2]
MASNTESLRNRSLANHPLHKEYYIRTANFHIMARGTRFRVHSFFLTRDSAYWRNEIADQNVSEDGQRPLGSRFSSPFPIDEDPEDFAAFLWVFYNPLQWATNQCIMHHWSTFPTLTVKDKIRILQDYDASRRDLLPLFTELAFRVEMLTLEEFRALDEDAQFEVTRARELILHRRLSAPSGDGDDLPTVPPLRHLSNEERSSIVAEVFGIPPFEAPASPEAGTAASNLVLSFFPFDFQHFG